MGTGDLGVLQLWTRVPSGGEGGRGGGWKGYFFTDLALTYTEKQRTFIEILKLEWQIIT